ncbi:hypothetical protein, partial [Escherichia albertii]|uniref:hypothetical protein n=1 Tax=Escherichia albertii TaxID=208962 RepID=UPI001ED922D2
YCGGIINYGGRHLTKNHHYGRYINSIIWCFEHSFRAQTIAYHLGGGAIDLIVKDIRGANFFLKYLMFVA